MFKRHALRVQIVKTPKSKAAPDIPQASQLSPEQFSHVVKEQMQNAVVLIGAAYTTKVVLDTARDVTLTIVKSKFQ